MSRVRRRDEWFDLLDRSKADREQRVTIGKSELVERSEILLPDRQSAELAAPAAYSNVVEFIAETCELPQFRDGGEHLHFVVRKAESG